MVNERIVKVDNILCAIRNVTEKDGCIELAMELFTTLLSSLDVEAYDSGDIFVLLSRLTDNTIPHNERIYISLCLLRFINYDSIGFIEDINMRMMLKMFDEVFETNIYKFFGINKNDQRHIKEAKLSHILLDFENDISKIIEGVSNFEEYSIFETNYMRQLGSKETNFITRPFLVPNEIKKNIQILFKKVSGFEKQRKSDFQESYHTLKKYLLQNNVEVECSSYYEHLIFHSLVKKTLLLLEQECQKTPISKPAKIFINKLDKKYPLHIQNEELYLTFILKNIGEGNAFDTSITLDTSIEIVKNSHNLGKISPNEIMEVEFPCKIIKPQDIIVVEIVVKYMNFDRTVEIVKYEDLIECQRKDIDWDALSKVQPYSLEPIEEEEGFVGRSEIMNNLVRYANDTGGVTSAYIYGQKRVGKTSIAKTLQRILEKEKSGQFITIYLDGGAYRTSDAVSTVRKLGERLSKLIQRRHDKFRDLEIPSFEDGFSSFTELLEQIEEIDNTVRILFILDEFDEIPVDVFKRGDVGDAFFLTLRTASSMKNYGFILIGGERMDYVITYRGALLNKFESVRVDYFDRQNQWQDFVDLVVKPIRRWFEISDEALVDLYNETSGNPFFTKLICKELYSLMVRRRDNHITVKEVNEAVYNSIKNVETNRFVHLWEDGIFDRTENNENTFLARKKVLLSFADLAREHNNVRKEIIIEKCNNQWDMASFEVINELSEYERRKVFINNDGSYSCKVSYFQKWLIDKGITEIIPTLMNDEMLKQNFQKQDVLRIKPEEIEKLIEKWGMYKGKRITGDTVRSWLNQFGSNQRQRYMYKVLNGVVFYSQARIRGKLQEAHSIIISSMKRTIAIDGRIKNRNDIILSYLDGVGKSGSALTRTYADINKIYVDNIIEKQKIGKTIEKCSKELPVFSLVFIDDFIGTGSSICEHLEEINQEFGDLLRRIMNEPGETVGTKKLNIFIVSICGFEKARERIVEKTKELNLNISVFICDPMTENEKVFNEQSKLFNNDGERTEALHVAQEFGVKLTKNSPMGYGECQSAVVFECNCPNNNLPILWATKPNFVPLFPRF